VTASIPALAWPPIRVRSARPSKREAPVSTFPHIKPWGAQTDRLTLGPLRTLRADLVELSLSRLLSDTLFYDDRIAAIYLRNCFPNRHRVKGLAGPECLDQRLSLSGYFLAKFRLRRRRSLLRQKIPKGSVVAIAPPSPRACAITICGRWPFRRLFLPFHVQSSSLLCSSQTQLRLLQHPIAFFAFNRPLPVLADH
jgi:hypothetical protein